jgi:hypothetical protein
MPLTTTFSSLKRNFRVSYGWVWWTTVEWHGERSLLSIKRTLGNPSLPKISSSFNGVVGGFSLSGLKSGLDGSW